ncbi:hypothetical protein HF078_19710 [Bacillus sp. RO2]|uniref:hypothetical protein n=1 Tax=Bacillus sp. RO2 TaxID=2723913 RepID=UPI00145CF699|nr:hypothetical protein [Bacillus sp. RO2]NMH75310.1 hypothetical protein [Bacillus sp. RO2]
MYEQVLNRKQFKSFQNVWEPICKKQRWLNDPYAPDGVRFNLLLPQEKLFFVLKKREVIGTVEFLKFNPKSPYCTVEGHNKYKFSVLEEIVNNQDKVWEIDKLCLKEAYQGRIYFSYFFHVFLDHIITYQPKYYIGLMEKKFYLMIKARFGRAIELKEEIKGPGTSLMAVMFDVERAMKDSVKMKALRKVLNNELGGFK